jgi:hypothetical protein
VNTKYLRNPRDCRHSGALPKIIKGRVKETEYYRYKCSTKEYMGKFYTLYHSKFIDEDGTVLKYETEWVLQ